MPVAPGLSGVSPFGGSIAKDSAARSGKKEDDLRALEADVRPATTRKLVELAESSDAGDSATWRLALVRALAYHEQRSKERGDLHLDVLRALVRLFAASDTGGAEEPRNAGNPGAERHLVRGTAAMALARSLHPLALKKLLAVALSGGETDPVGVTFAVGALRSIPPDIVRSKDLSQLFSSEAIDSVLRSESRTADRDLDKLTPFDLVQLGAASVSPRERGERTSREANIPEATADDYARDLRYLLELRSLPRQLSRVQAWQRAFDEDPTWTLRTWAFLGEILDRPVFTWGQKKAHGLVNAKSDVTRSAAAWALSVTSPESVAELLERNDPIVTRAVLRQASEGQVARVVFSALERASLPKEDEDAAWGMVLQAPSVWASLSTARLRKLEKEHSPAVTAALSSRLRSTARGLGPDAATIRSWLNDKSPQLRSSAALGLAYAATSTAQGMLYQAYRNESDERVRRAIVSSISQTPLGKNATFLELLRLDPDDDARDLVFNSSESRRRAFFVGHSARAVAKVHDRQGRILEIPPAPDGFTGIVGSSF